MNKEKVKKYLVEASLCLLQVLFSKICLFNFSFSIALPFALVRLLNGSNLAIVAFEYALANVIHITQIQNLLFIGYEVVVLSLYYFSLEFLKSKRKNLIIVIFLLISKSLLLYFALFKLEVLLKVFIQCYLTKKHIYDKII